MSTANLSEARRIEIARNAGLAPRIRRGGRPRQCECGSCTRCKRRASEQASRAKRAKAA